MVETNTLNFKKLYFDKIRALYPQSFLNDEKIIKILENCGTEDELKTIFHYLSLALKSSPNIKEKGNMFFDNIDNSSYDIKQWIEAISYFHQWLEENDRKTNLETMIGYLQCCGQSPENKMIKYKFIDLLKDMLATHGFRG